jgi:hypothetical protein
MIFNKQKGNSRTIKEQKMDNAKKPRNKPVYTGILVNMRMPNELKEKFQAHSKRKGMTLSERVRLLIETDLAGKVKV